MTCADRNFWAIVKELSGLGDQQISAAPNAESLAEHFAQKMANGKGETDSLFIPTDTHKVPLKSFKVRYESVLKALQKLDPNKSANGVGPRFLKECAEVLAPDICKLFRFIVRKAEFPHDWKIGRVTGVDKRAAVTEPANYRPVTVVDNLETVFEEALRPQLEHWLDNFIPEWQFGFLKELGTVDYGVALSMTIQSCLKRRKEGVLVLSDIKGAFDRC